MRAIPPALLAASRRLFETHAWLWCFDVYIAKDNTIVRLVSNKAGITVAGEPYLPFSVDFEAFEENQEADLINVRMRASNVSREFSALLERQDLRGEKVSIFLVNANDFDIRMQWGDYAIADIEASETSADFTLSADSVADTEFPLRRYFRRCGFDYRGPECGWPTADNLPLGVIDIATCSKEKEGLNGCRAHGAAYAAAGHTPLHPERFGGFRSPVRRGP